MFDYCSDYSCYTVYKDFPGLLYSEESLSNYKTGGYHPVCLGDTFKDNRYKICHKLRYSDDYTMWLAYDAIHDRWVSLKILTAAHSTCSSELRNLKILQIHASKNDHDLSGKFVLQLLDSFVHAGPNGDHQCLVFELLGPSIGDVINRYIDAECDASMRFENETILRISRQLLEAVAFIHDAGLVHADISVDNVFLCRESLATSWTSLFSIIGAPFVYRLAREDGEPLQSGVPVQLVKCATWPGWFQRTDEDLRLMDLNESFLRDHSPAQLARPRFLWPPEAFFENVLDHRVDLWSAGFTIYSFIFAFPPYLFVGDDYQIIRSIIYYKGGLPQEWNAKLKELYPKGSEEQLSNHESEVIDNLPLKLEKLFKEEAHNDDLKPLYSIIDGLMQYLPANRIEALQALELLNSKLSKISPIDTLNLWFLIFGFWFFFKMCGFAGKMSKRNIGVSISRKFLFVFGPKMKVGVWSQLNAYNIFNLNGLELIMPRRKEETEILSILGTPINVKSHVGFLGNSSSLRRFKRLNTLGEGTYGVVYRAKDLENGTIVALKTVRIFDDSKRDGIPNSALRELTLLRSLNHQNVIKVLDVAVGSRLDDVDLVLEYAEQDMAYLLDNVRVKFTISEVKCLMSQLFEGLDYIHSNGIIHRDLKISNLLLNSKGILKIARSFTDRPMTPEVVTIWYRSPELLFGATSYSSAVDQWAAGCIMGEVIKCEPILPGDTELQQVDLITKLIGAPNERIWPGFRVLPGGRQFRLHDLRPNRIDREFNHESRATVDLINDLLTYDPAKRITAREALESEYFNEKPSAIDPSFMPTYPEYRNNSNQRSGSQSGSGNHEYPRRPSSEHRRYDDDNYNAVDDLLPDQQQKSGKPRHIGGGYDYEFDERELLAGSSDVAPAPQRKRVNKISPPQAAVSRRRKIK
ncbi:kinase-like domain-containing protein [Lipomyces japonicus]|uniref:kinase-like domain-containing protein n=1 Tax=Lipomyces japonicus TaxID=56871 RepID=UPI0034CDDF01